MTFSNCDHSVSTDENSLPTYTVSVYSHPEFRRTYGDDCFEGSIQFVNVAEDLFEALRPVSQPNSAAM